MFTLVYDIYGVNLEELVVLVPSRRAIFFGHLSETVEVCKQIACANWSSVMGDLCLADPMRTAEHFCLWDPPSQWKFKNPSCT